MNFRGEQKFESILFLGIAFLGIGLWAWNEKQQMRSYCTSSFWETLSFPIMKCFAVTLCRKEVCWWKKLKYQIRNIDSISNTGSSSFTPPQLVLCDKGSDPDTAKTVDAKESGKWQQIRQ
ncbi:UNVERIFIED_CONTAM: hypothetical protein K2H54_031144 [Gekko kuhli]